MHLHDLLLLRLDDVLSPLADATATHYERCLRQYGAHLGRRPTVDDFCPTSLIGWGRAAIEEGRSPHTANQRIKQIRALWEWAWRRQIIDRAPPRRLRIHCDRIVPDEWTDGQLERLFAAAAAQQGWIGPHKAADFWAGVLWYAWNTGARAGEIWALEPSMIDLEESQANVPARIRKGSELPMRWWLTPRCVDALGAVLQRSEDRVFTRPWAHNASVYKHYAKLLDAAKLPIDRRSGLQKIRRTVATRIKIRGGDPAVWLGHAPKTVADEHYIDRWAVQTALRNVWPVDYVGADPSPSGADKP